MTFKIIEFILPKRDSRGRKIGKNVLLLGLFQSISIISSFLLVPMTINYISTSQYGIWLTISSIVGWFSLVDIGLGAGLRNRLTEALAKNDNVLARKYVSTTYIMLGIIVLFLFFIFAISNMYIPWDKVLNQSEDMSAMLASTMFVVVSFFALRLIVQLIGTILTAHLMPAASVGITTCSNVIILFIIFVLSRTVTGDLYTLSWVLSSVPVLLYIIVSVFLFLGKFKHIRPSFLFFDRTNIKTLLSLGVGFFVINISTIVLFQTSNILIIQLFDNKGVVVYNLAYKLFSIMTGLFSILIQPFWTGYTDAWVKKDFDWIKGAIGKLMLIWKLLVGLGGIMFILSPFIYKIWVGDNIDIPWGLSFLVFLYFSIHCYGGVFNIFINGTGKIRLQMCALGMVTFVYIPLVLFMVKFLKLGLISIPLSLIFSNFYSLFVARMQYKKLISGTAKGIWNK